MPQLIVFTDLDGTLLDIDRYGWDAADEALREIRVRNVPLILVSSKTQAEMEPLRLALQNDAPFIIENGGAIFIPEGIFDFSPDGAEFRTPYHVIEMGVTYDRLRSGLKEVAQTVGVDVRGFGDMSVDEVALRTGLSPAGARLAKQRQYDEPFVMVDGGLNAERFVCEAAHAGLVVTRGDRFWHLHGPSDKGRACRYLIDCYRQAASARGTVLTTAALGNSANDASMLAVVDRPIVIPNTTTYRADISAPTWAVGSGPGPAGWNRAVLDLLASMGRG
jgi:mannosyl-3-phosphoglycerate phosphatase